MAQPLPQITVVTEAEAAPIARAEVRSVPTLVPRERDQPLLKSVTAPIGSDTSEPPKDYFIERDGLRFAGVHLILDLWGAKRLDDAALIEKALVDAVNAAGATLLHIHVHKFGEGGGVSGVAVLAESHISVHTWPERGYAAFDIFMCGCANPAKAIPCLREAFEPEWVAIAEHKRGIF